MCHAPAPSAGIWSSTGYILVLFILLVIITRGLWI
ncbi:YjcZ family sporulation protein [Paenibacillus sp. SN-8-1]